MKLDDNANKLISLLCDHGYQAFCVGGCVRDALMGINAKDTDITTSALPQEVEAVLDTAQIKYIETGLKHGTITAIIDHIPYEITTFRCDGEYLDNRHPKEVNFVSDISLDLSRRDFTINAIAYNEKQGIVDLFGGKEDIENRIIKAVGDPDKRFQEDALRIMRALRFSATLGFEIEKNTSDAIFRNKHLLNNIAVERVYTELIKLLLGENVEAVLQKYRDVIAEIIPELKPSFDCQQNTKWHLYDVYTHTVKSVAAAPRVDYLRLTLLLHDIGKPFVKRTDEKGIDHFKTHPQKSLEISKDILKRLKVSNLVYNKACQLIEIHDMHIYPNDENMKMWLRRLGEETIFDFIEVKLADYATHNMDYAGDEYNFLLEIKKLVKAIIDGGEPYKISQLAINGNDLIELGYKGTEIAQQLEYLIEKVSADKTLNTKQNLIDMSKK